MDFQWTFTPEDARLVYALLASVLIPFVVGLLGRLSLSKGAKFGAAVLLSIVGAVLSEYAAGTLAGPMSAVAAFTLIFTAAQAHFASWFKGLGLDEWIAQLGSK